MMYSLQFNASPPGWTHQIFYKRSCMIYKLYRLLIMIFLFIYEPTCKKSTSVMILTDFEMVVWHSCSFHTGLVDACQ